jgi:predicted TIM-barrel fold metal-dependent hydrolase
MIVDFYTQTGTGLRNFAGKIVQPLEDTSSADLLVAAMDRAGIDRSVTFAPRWVGGEFVDPQYAEANAAVAEAVAAHPERLIGFARVNPNYGKDAVALLERCLTEYGFKGVHFDPEWENFDPADRGLAYPLYEVAAKHNAPILFHTWYSPSQPGLYWEMADDFSDLPIIISHLGGRLIADAVAIAKRAKNVYLETSDNMYGVTGPAGGIGADRILFGSNTPFSSPEVELFKVTSSDLSASDKELILGGNAARLLS